MSVFIFFLTEVGMYDYNYFSFFKLISYLLNKCIFISLPDSQTVNRVRRLSRNPALLGAVRRFSVSRSSCTTPSGTVNRSICEDIRRLDNEFSNSPRNSVRSYTNKAYNSFLDGQESLASSMSRNQLTIPEIRIQAPSRRTVTVDAHSGSLNENKAV